MLDCKSFIRMFVALAVAGSFACDRGIGPYDPDEEASQPNLDRIYPDGARRAQRPGSAGPMNPAAPTQRGEPALDPSPTRGNTGNTASAAEVIRGRVELAAGLEGAAPADALLFVIARRHGQVGGPPLAVVRVERPSFPVEFEIGQAQVMIPSMRFEGEIALSARLDGDGNAMTKLPGDLAGEIANPILPGSSGVDLTLDQKL